MPTASQPIPPGGGELTLRCLSSNRSRTTGHWPLECFASRQGLRVDRFRAALSRFNPTHNATASQSEATGGSIATTQVGEGVPAASGHVCCALSQVPTLRLTCASPSGQCKRSDRTLSSRSIVEPKQCRAEAVSSPSNPPLTLMKREGCEVVESNDP